MIKKIQTLDSALKVIWQDDTASVFPFIWLRDTDLLGFHPQTNERLFDLSSIDVLMKPQDVTLTERGVELQWPNEERRSLFSSAHLANYADACQLVDNAQVDYKGWFSEFSATRFIAKDCLQPARLKVLLQTLKRDGLVIVSQVEGTHGGEDFGELIGFKRETNFGVTFEVINKADPNNLAYTAVALPLHTDLSNQEKPPGYQFLHCIENGAHGGESILADGFSIAQALKRDDPQAYGLLCSEEMPFRFYDDACDIRFRHPLISEKKGQIQRFIFNAHLADSFNSIAGNCLTYYMAYQKLMREIRKDKYALQLKLQAGEMMIFDNMRVLHGRKSFDPTTGDRHLRGYYIDHGEVDSKLRMLSK